MAKKAKPESSSDAGVRGVDLAEIERLLDFMKEHGLEEFEYEREGIHVLLKKAPNERSQGVHGAASAVASVAGAAPPSKTSASRSGSLVTERASAEGESRAEAEDVHLI